MRGPLLQRDLHEVLQAEERHIRPLHLRRERGQGVHTGMEGFRLRDRWVNFYFIQFISELFVFEKWRENIESRVKNKSLLPEVFVRAEGRACLTIKQNDTRLLKSRKPEVKDKKKNSENDSKKLPWDSNSTLLSFSRSRCVCNEPSRKVSNDIGH